MEFVNANGEKINMDLWHERQKSLKKPVVKAVAPASKEGPRHSKGWLVRGYSPNQMDALNSAYESALTDYKEEGADHPGDFDVFEQAWMAKHIPAKVRTKPYQLRDAASQCAELALKAGWQRVTVEEVLRA